MAGGGNGMWGNDCVPFLTASQILFVQQLIEMSWTEFNSGKIAGDDEETGQATEQVAAAKQAMARYFILYLQGHKEKPLAKIFQAMRAEHVSETLVIDKPDPKTILETNLKQPWPQIDADFAKWFKSLGPSKGLELPPTKVTCRSIRL